LKFYQILKTAQAIIGQGKVGNKKDDRRKQRRLIAQVFDRDFSFSLISNPSGIVEWWMD